MVDGPIIGLLLSTITVSVHCVAFHLDIHNSEWTVFTNPVNESWRLLMGPLDQVLKSSVPEWMEGRMPTNFILKNWCLALAL